MLGKCEVGYALVNMLKLLMNTWFCHQNGCEGRYAPGSNVLWVKVSKINDYVVFATGISCAWAWWCGAVCRLQRGDQMEARYDGLCDACRKPYPAGTDIRKLPSGRWGHAACAEALARRDGGTPAAPPPKQQADWKVTLSGVILWIALAWGYDAREAVVAAIKSLPGRRWDGDSKRWSIPAEHTLRLAGLLLEAGVAADLVEHLRTSPELSSARGASQERQDAIEASHAASAEVCDVPAPDGLAYLPFQKAGINALLSRDNALLADDMGLGKTIQAIGVINAALDAGETPRVLIVCPASLKRNWARELERWLVHPLRVRVVNGTKAAVWPSRDEVDVVICNYDVLTAHAKRITVETWDLAVLDEAHSIKNPKAKRTRALLGTWDKEAKQWIGRLQARRTVCLTGTPIRNGRPIELWPLLQLLDGGERGLGRSWKYFVKRYCGWTQTKYGQDVSGATNLAELQERLRASIMIRRTKDQVLTELPPKRRQVIELPANGHAGTVAGEWGAIGDALRKLAALREALELAKGGTDEEYRDAVLALKAGYRAAFTEIAEVRHATALAKIDDVAGHARNVAEETGALVLWVWHRDVAEALAKRLSGGDPELRVLSATGEQSAEERDAVVQAFQRGEAEVIICSIAAMGTGHTLTRASHEVFAELCLVPGDLTQAEDRCHRIGQD